MSKRRWDRACETIAQTEESVRSGRELLERSRRLVKTVATLLR